MFLVLLKIKNKIYFENLNDQDELVDFIDSVESKYGEVEFTKSIIVTGSDDDIEEIVNMIEEHYYLHIVGHRIDEKVYKELLALLEDLKLDVKIVYGIEFEEDRQSHTSKKIETPKNIGSLLNTKVISEIIEQPPVLEEIQPPLYSFYVYWFENSVVFNLEEMTNFEPASSFIQTFENLDEVMSVFEGFKHDFMEIIDEETASSFTITAQLEAVKEYIENKITSMPWKSTQAIKYLNGRFKQNKVDIVSMPLGVEGDYFTAREVMKKLRISDQTLANWRRCGLIDFRKISNRKYLYVIDSVNDIFENGVDTTGVVTLTETSIVPALYTPTPKQINYKEEILNILKPIAFKIPEYKYQKQNFFLNFGNVGISSSPQVMINNDFQLVDFIKKSVIKDTPQEVYEYLITVFGEGKEPRIDSSKRIQPEFSKFYLNKLYDKAMVSIKS
jgi:hypothetical protein